MGLSVSARTQRGTDFDKATLSGADALKTRRFFLRFVVEVCIEFDQLRLGLIA